VYYFFVFFYLKTAYSQSSYERRRYDHDAMTLSDVSAMPFMRSVAAKNLRANNHKSKADGFETCDTICVCLGFGGTITSQKMFDFETCACGVCMHVRVHIETLVTTDGLVCTVSQRPEKRAKRKLTFSRLNAAPAPRPCLQQPAKQPTCELMQLAYLHCHL
jgi:hypothetical protein